MLGLPFTLPSPCVNRMPLLPVGEKAGRRMRGYAAAFRDIADAT
jgi:hypothetical protein